MATPPDAAAIRAISQMDFTAAGYVEDSPDPLQALVDEATAYVTFVTTRTWVSPDPPDLIVPILNQVARMRTEQIAQQSSSDNIETAGDFDMISGFSAGSYSETRRQPAVGGQPRPINPWPSLESLLWMLLSSTPSEDAAGGNATVEARRDYWRWLLGYAPPLPAWSMIEADWADGLGAGGELLFPFIGFPTPTDFPPGF